MKRRVKKIVCCALLGTVICFTITGCNIELEEKTNDTPKSVSNEKKKDDTFESVPNKSIYEFIDPDTGVHYWIYSRDCGYSGMGGMTPRLNADGSVMVTPKE